MISLDVDGYIPRSPNASARQHWGRRVAERTFWECALAKEAWDQNAKRATGKRHVTYRIRKPGKVKLRDEDNLVASIKHCQDALVNLGLLIDDDPEHCSITVVESNGCPRYGINIQLEDI